MILFFLLTSSHQYFHFSQHEDMLINTYRQTLKIGLPLDGNFGNFVFTVYHPVPEFARSEVGRTYSFLLPRPGDNIYPWIQYKGFSFWRAPEIVRNAAEHFRKMKELDTRDDDVFLITAIKSGTHWLHEIVSQLLSQTSEYNTFGNKLETHLEYKDIDVIAVMQGQRLLHSHLPISWLTPKHFQNHRKTIYLNRNPKDRYVSLYHFYRGKAGVPDWTWSEFYEKEVVNDTFLTGWFNYTMEMTAAVHNKDINIIQVLYEDLLLEPKIQIRRIADYLEVPYTDELICDIVEKCKFENLKDNKYIATQSYYGEQPVLFRKGVIGDWKNWFTVKQNEEFDATYEKEMENIDVKFRFDPPT